MSARLKWNRIFLIVRWALFLFVLSITVQVAVGPAGIFSYRDEKGGIHFTDDLSKIPKQYRDNKEGIRTHNEGRNTHRSTPAPSASRELIGSVSSNQEVKIPLIPAGGGNFLVDTVLNGRFKARLMLDTGASLITLTEKIGAQLGVSTYTQSAELPFNTAGGEEWMPLLALDSVKIGSAEIQMVEASVNKHIKDIDGLLGMSFLGDFRFEIDRANKLLTLRPPQNQGDLAWDGKPGSWWLSRFEHLDEVIKSYSARASFLQRRGHAKTVNMQKTVEFYRNLRRKLQTKASISGLPEKFRTSL